MVAIPLQTQPVRTQSVPEVSSSAASLRAEIVKAQETRSDMLKRKLEIGTILGAVALGFKGDPNLPYSVLALICLPFACAYVDLICAHLTLRMMVIGAYFRSSGEDGYEEFVQNARRLALGRVTMNAFSLEDWASYYSSIILAIATAVAGYALYALPLPNGDTNARVDGRLPCLIASLLGIFFTCAIMYAFRMRREGLEKLEKAYKIRRESGKESMADAIGT